MKNAERKSGKWALGVFVIIVVMSCIALAIWYKLRTSEQHTVDLRMMCNAAWCVRVNLPPEHGSSEYDLVLKYCESKSSIHGRDEMEIIRREVIFHIAPLPLAHSEMSSLPESLTFLIMARIEHDQHMRIWLGCQWLYDSKHSDPVWSGSPQIGPKVIEIAGKIEDGLQYFYPDKDAQWRDKEIGLGYYIVSVEGQTREYRVCLVRR